MEEKSFSIQELLNIKWKRQGVNPFQLICITKSAENNCRIVSRSLASPGLPLSGFYNAFQSNAIQLFNTADALYLQQIVETEGTERIEEFLSKEIPCCIFSGGCNPCSEFIEIAEKKGIPIFISQLSHTILTVRLIRELNGILADYTLRHGVLVEVSGLGVLIEGKSGVGKSETALELINRGHRMVADDVVKIRCLNDNMLLGEPKNAILGIHMEVRGLGIINIAQMYGVNAIRKRKEVELVVELEEWDSKKRYERLGFEPNLIDIMGVPIPHLLLPIKPGRNIPTIIETAVMNERLRSGHFNEVSGDNRAIFEKIGGSRKG